MKRILPLLALLATTILFSNCATLVSKKTPVTIRTNPVGANITILNKKGKEVFTGISPASVSLKPGAGYFAKASYTVQLAMPGFEQKNVQLNYGINGWYFGNVLLGGVLGMLIIDPLTGHMWTIKNPIVDETLVKTATTTSRTPLLNILTIDEISEETKSTLVKIR